VNLQIEVHLRQLPHRWQSDLDEADSSIFDLEWDRLVFEDLVVELKVLQLDLPLEEADV
jgi:hypothetical protein